MHYGIECIIQLVFLRQFFFFNFRSFDKNTLLKALKINTNFTNIRIGMKIIFDLLDEFLLTVEKITI